MIVNEKALLRQMKEACKTYGYSVVVHDDVVYLSNGFWLVGIDKDDVPGAILGMFGEHIRDIPKNGDAYKVIKGKDEIIVQTRILEDALKPVKSMFEQRDEAYANIVLVRMRRTNLTYEGLQIWQAMPGNEVYLIDPRYAAMIDNTKEVCKVGQGIYIEDATSSLWIPRCTKPEDDAYLKHLEKITWVKE